MTPFTMPAPDWIEKLLDEDWNREASIAVDRWLQYLDLEFPTPKPEQDRPLAREVGS